MRREVEQALQRRAQGQGQGLRVIPVLLGGAVMPSAAALAEPVLEGMTGLCALDAHVFQSSGMAVRIRVLGEEAPNTLTAMNNLAGTQLAQRDFAEARRLNEHVLAINCRLNGEDDIDTLRSMNNLTIVLMEQSELIDARRLGVRALAGRRRLLGETHFDTLSSMNNLAVVLWLLGERNEAIELMAIAANTASSTLGPNHRHTRISADWLAQMRRATG